MALSASGQWLVDSGMQLLSRDERLAWHKWASAYGWSPKSPEPKRLPPDVAELAVKALDALISKFSIEINSGALSIDDELDAANDMDSAQAVLSSLQEDRALH